MTTVTAPLAGRAIGLAAVPDPLFAGAMVAPGGAIDPVHSPGPAVSPVDGTVVSLHPHAFVVVDSAGHGVLTHLGIDTVQLAGVGFRLLVKRGAEVRRGEPLVMWDPAAVSAGGRSPICPVIALEATANALRRVAESGDLQAGDLLFEWL